MQSSPSTHCSGRSGTHSGRIRQAASCKHALCTNSEARRWDLSAFLYVASEFIPYDRHCPAYRCLKQTQIMGEIKAINMGAHQRERTAEADLPLPRQNENPGKN